MNRLLRYTLVGGLATAVHYALLVLCVEAFGWPAWPGSGAGAVIGAQVAYFGNRRFTFGHGGSLAASWLKFQITAVFGALQGMVVVWAGVEFGLHYLAAQALATLTGLLLTFAINRRWTFG
jgi:putative flippase GtrA